MRLFVAVWPPDDVLELVAGLARPERPQVRWTSRDQWHVTLRFLGEMEDESEASAALTEAAAIVRRTEARLGPAVELLNQRVVSIPVAGLDDIAAAVLDATRAIGRPPEDRPFRGHLTLARLKGLRRAEARQLAGTEVDSSWPVAEIYLVQSRLSPRGARYERIARFPLSGSGDDEIEA